MNSEWIEYATLSQLYAHAKQLALDELHLRERRLGTANELPEDFQRVRHLAHFINNRLTIELLTGLQCPMSLQRSAY
jgi:hypothetical protein